MRILYFFNICLFAQFISVIELPAQRTGELKTDFRDAEYYLALGDYKGALSIYSNLLTANPKNANINYRIGICYLNMPGQKTRSIPYLEFAASHISEKYLEGALNEINSPPQTLFLLGTAYQINNDFVRAKSAFNNYKKYLNLDEVYEIDFVDKQIKACDIAETLIKEPVNINSRNIDEIIAQNKPVFNPVISAKGEVFVDTGRNQFYNPVMSANGEVFVCTSRDEFYNQVWVIRKHDGKWGKAVNITSEIKSEGDCFPSFISADGTILYLVKLNKYESDIYESTFKGGKWSEIEKLNKNINTRFWETYASVSHDEKTLFFISNRPGGLGGLDIYKSSMEDKGKWGPAINLGSDINTPYNEESPVITDNDKILFFSSQGHYNMGGYDIFKSVRQSTDKWSVPVNLGYPVNTTDDDLFYYPVENGEKALYAGIPSLEESQSVIKELNFVPVRMVRKIKLNGKLNLQDNPGTLDSSFRITVYNKKTGNLIDSITPDLETGRYNLDIDTGDYSVVFRGNEYKTLTEIISIPADYPRKEFILNPEIIPLEVSSGVSMLIRNIFFEYDSYKLNQQAQLDIERLYIVMKKYPELNIEVIGHADSKGTSLYNLELSKKRASTVVHYLVDKGIDPIRFVTKGLGERNNIALNENPNGTDNPEGRKLNRHAEIKVLQPDNYKVRVEPVPVPDYLSPYKKIEYTVLLSYSMSKIPANSFNKLEALTDDKVSEQYLSGQYVYSLGRFTSRNEPEIFLKDSAFKHYPEAKVVELLNLSSFIPESTDVLLNNLYGIQLIALRNPVDAGHFSNIEPVKVYECSDGYSRYVYGEYTSQEKAVQNLQMVREKGYPDAFAIDLYRIKSKSLNNSSVNNYKGKYTIQLTALKNRKGRNSFKELANVRIIKAEDKIYRYLYGEFNTLNEANNELTRIRKLGYADAFIKEIE